MLLIALQAWNPSQAHPSRQMIYKNFKKEPNEFIGFLLALSRTISLTYPASLWMSMVFFRKVQELPATFKDIPGKSMGPPCRLPSLEHIAAEGSLAQHDEWNRHQAF